MNGKRLIFGIGLTFVSAETIHLAHHDMDVPKQAHTHHEQHLPPRQPSFTIVATGSATITPFTGSTITTSGSFVS